MYSPSLITTQQIKRGCSGPRYDALEKSHYSLNNWPGNKTMGPDCSPNQSEFIWMSNLTQGESEVTVFVLTPKQSLVF